MRLAAVLLCAIVFWSQATGKDWQPLQSFDSIAECRDFIEFLRRMSPADDSRLCLPSGTDPRPRGKERE